MLISDGVSTSTRWRCWWLRVAVLRAGEVWAACSGPALMMSPVKITDCTALQPTCFLSQPCGKKIAPAQIKVHAGPITGLRWAICPAPSFFLLSFLLVLGFSVFANQPPSRLYHTGIIAARLSSLYG